GARRRDGGLPAGQRLLGARLPPRPQGDEKGGAPGSAGLLAEAPSRAAPALLAALRQPAVPPGRVRPAAHRRGRAGRPARRRPPLPPHAAGGGDRPAGGRGDRSVSGSPLTHSFAGSWMNTAVAWRSPSRVV